MATYAVLGSTGQVGGSILEVMLQSPERKIHALARSRRKLLRQKPELDSSPDVSIYEGALSDTDILRECITGTSVVFLCAAASDNIPYTDIAQQQAKCVVKALEAIREKDPRTRLPQLIVLSSATLNEKFTQSTPAIGEWVIKRAASWVYADLRLAEEYLGSHDWIKQVHVKPGGLSHDKPHGHVLSTERSQSFLSFLDLAAGMVEIADADDDKWDMQDVSVCPATPGTRFESKVPYFVLRGLLFHFLPWSYPYVTSWLPWSAI